MEPLLDMSRMSADGYVRHAQEAMADYFRDFKTIEICISYSCENLPQCLVNACGREPAKDGRTQFGSHEQVVPTCTPNSLIQVTHKRRAKQIPVFRIGLAFQVERPQDQRSIPDQDGSNLNDCHDLNCLRPPLSSADSTRTLHAAVQSASMWNVELTMSAVRSLGLPSSNGSRHFITCG